MLTPNFEMRTKRLIIRPYQLSDYQEWKDTYLNLPAPVNQWCSKAKSKEQLTKKHFKEILSSQKKNRNEDRYYDFTVFDKKTGSIIGHTSLMDISRAVFQNAFLGYTVHSPYWRKGYGKEMVEATILIAFKTLKLHRLEAGIDPANKRSIALAKSLGMRREGVSKKRLYLGGKWCDMVIYALTAEDRGFHQHTGDMVKNRR